MSAHVQWHCHDFDSFTLQGLYDALQLRDQVFVLEQQSIYGDVDGLDQVALHLEGRDESGRLLAYARLLPPGSKVPDAVAIGRVVVAAGARGTGLGRRLMQAALAACARHHPDTALWLSAQEDARDFYAEFGFLPVSEAYDDGGILHRDMRREAAG